MYALPAGLISAALLASSLVGSTAPQAAALYMPSGDATYHIGGPDRYATAVAISQQYYPVGQGEHPASV
jgi:hypothetical protein